MLKNYIYVITWALLIAVLSFLPGSSFPKTEITRADLLVHFTFYAFLSYLWLAGAFKNQQGKPLTTNQYITIIISTILYSGAIELIQGTEFVSRACQLSDFIANSVGCLIGTAVFIVQPAKFRMLWIARNTPKNSPEKDQGKPSSLD